jgi:hypothetical protein
MFTPHADGHAMAWDLKVPNASILGNDGGVYRFGCQRFDTISGPLRSPAFYAIL